MVENGDNKETVQVEIGKPFSILPKFEPSPDGKYIPGTQIDLNILNFGTGYIGLTPVDISDEPWKLNYEAPEDIRVTIIMSKGDYSVDTESIPVTLAFVLNTNSNNNFEVLTEMGDQKYKSTEFDGIGHNEDTGERTFICLLKNENGEEIFFRRNIETFKKITFQINRI